MIQLSTLFTLALATLATNGALIPVTGGTYDYIVIGGGAYGLVNEL